MKDIKDINLEQAKQAYAAAAKKYHDTYNQGSWYDNFLKKNNPIGLNGIEKSKMFEKAVLTVTTHEALMAIVADKKYHAGTEFTGIIKTVTISAAVFDVTAADIANKIATLPKQYSASIGAGGRGSVSAVGHYTAKQLQANAKEEIFADIITPHQQPAVSYWNCLKM